MAKGAGTEDYSGSTAWHNSVRSRLSLAPAGTNALTIDHVKANLGAKAATVRLEWRDGVPLVLGAEAAANAAADALAREQEHKAALVALIQDFDRRGEWVTTSMTGPSTVYKMLASHPGFPAQVTKDVLPQLIRSLEGEQRVFRRSVRNANRKDRLVFTCRGDVGRAPNVNGE